MNDFITPPKHINFLAKKLCGSMGEIIDCAVAHMEKNGGGPTEKHTHEHNHFFVVTKGEAKILYGDETVIVKEDEAFLVDGAVSHSVWNNSEGETVMVGISVKKQ